MIRLDLVLLPWMLVNPLTRPTENQVHGRHANTKQDIQHGPTEASAESHNWPTQFCDGDVGHEITATVADGEDGETEDGITDVKYDTKCLEYTDNFASDRADPGY